MAKSRAIHRYKYGKHKGKTVPQKEIIRRVEQSLLATGRLRPAQAEEPRMVTGVSTTKTMQSEQQGSTSFVENVDNTQDIDRGTINIT